MSFKPLENETPRQKQFREDMEAAYFEICRYAGRGMFGKETYGVVCGGDEQPHKQDVYRATEVRLSEDTMGLGTILYVR